MSEAVSGGLVWELRDLDRAYLRAELRRDRRLDGRDVERGRRRESLTGPGAIQRHTHRQAPFTTFARVPL